MTIYNFELLNVPFANTAVASEIAPFPDYNRGFGIAFSLTDGKPEMKGFNGLLKMVTTSVIYLKQRGISEWDANLEYVAGKSFVVEGDKLYQAKTTNTNKQPSLSQNDWILRASISDIKVSTNGNLKRTENQDGTITLEVPTAGTEQRGAVRQATSTEVANKSNVNAYINPANVGQTFGASLSENGWCRLPNGLILQWGEIPAGNWANTHTGTQSFPISFNTACLQVIISSNSGVVSGGATDEGLDLTSKSNTGFNWISKWNSRSVSNGSIPYFAIGY